MAWRELSPQAAARNPRPAVLDCRSFSSSRRQFPAAGTRGVRAAMGGAGLEFGSCPGKPAGAFAALSVVLLAVGATFAPTITNAQSLCTSCEAQIGLGATYHFWSPTGGLVLAASLSWDESRYELGVFRVARAQVLRDEAYREGRLMADPYWGLSLSRRWQLFQSGPMKVLFGFGLALKTESDQLSATRWDFASQLGLRFRIPGQLAAAELAVRHWSNAGIRLPNHGQDFVTLTFRLNTDRFGIDRAEQISLHPVVESITTLVARNFDSEGVSTMSDETLARLIAKARMLRELHRARVRVQQLERQLRGETAKVEEEPEIPAFLTRAHPLNPSA